MSGIGCAGNANCHRMSTMRRKPSSRKHRLVTRYCSPMTLWSVEIMRIGRQWLYTAGMATSREMPAHPAGERDLSRTYVLVLVVEAIVIGALYWLGAHFS